MATLYTRSTFPWGKIVNVIEIPMGNYTIEIIEYKAKNADNVKCVEGGTQFFINGASESCSTMEQAIIRAIELAYRGANSRIANDVTQMLTQNITMTRADMDEIKSEKGYDPRILYHHFQHIEHNDYVWRRKVQKWGDEHKTIRFDTNSPQRKIMMGQITSIHGAITIDGEYFPNPIILGEVEP